MQFWLHVTTNFTANYDGKDNSVVGNSSNGDIVALTRIDASTTRAVNKKGGKITFTQTFVVSSDAKTRTMTGTGTYALGQTVNRVRSGTSSRDTQPGRTRFAPSSGSRRGAAVLLEQPVLQRAEEVD